MSEKAKNYNNLPSVVIERSNHLIGLPPVDGESKTTEQLRTFVQSIISSHDEDTVVTEMQKDFLLGQKRARLRPRKCRLKRKGEAADRNASNRGKKRMTCSEKRKRGLLRLEKKNKTFTMFVPIHRMWREYAEEALTIDHFLQKSGTCSARVKEIVQNKCKKLEFFGSIIKVTKSRCSEYIGLQGIVIQETKNTFSIITVDDKVKIIPKLHSEFSFVLKNVGFSILGNHLHQRPVDKAKQNFKKHCLWL